MNNAIFFLRGLTLVLASTVACATDGVNEGSTESDIDLGVRNQRPVLNCVVRSGDDISKERILSSNAQEDTFGDPYTEGDTLEFDCTQTTDDFTAAEKLVFGVDMDYDPAAPNYLDQAASSFTHPANTPGRFSMAVRATDEEGLSVEKTFTLVVQCADEQSPTIAEGAVSITAGAQLNYFNYTINAAQIGGGTTFEYSWDFDGDEVFDPYFPSDTDATWTESTSLTGVYTPFAGNRSIGLKVRNECQYETSTTVELNFAMENIERIPASQATAKGYHYVQADLEGTPATEQRHNGDYLVTWYPDDSVKRVKCDYSFKRTGEPASLSVNSRNWYKSVGNKDDDFATELDFNLTGIADSGQVGEQSFSDTAGNVSLDSASYKVSAADDGRVAEHFQKDGACTIALRIIRAEALVPCAENERNQADFQEGQTALQFFGEFQCPNLVENTQGTSTAVNNGKFFCEEAPVNQCVGGGGGGSGGIPPPEQ